MRGLTALLLDEVGCSCESSRHTVGLLATELFVNAAAHGIEPVDVYCLHGERVDRVTVIVRDMSEELPGLRARAGWGLVSQQAEGGHGLVLVGSLATEWGYRPLGGGKEVWFTVRVLDCNEN